MFNWFKRKPVEQTTATDDMMLGDYPGHVPPRPIPPPSKPFMPLVAQEAVYTIGVNSEGATQFRIKMDYGSATLTMTTAGVIDLIEDLAHSIRKDYNVVIVPEDEA
jgi:hypothetical protein